MRHVWQTCRGRIGRSYQQDCRYLLAGAIPVPLAYVEGPSSFGLDLRGRKNFDTRRQTLEIERNLPVESLFFFGQDDYFLRLARDEIELLDCRTFINCSFKSPAKRGSHLDPPRVRDLLPHNDAVPTVGSAVSRGQIPELQQVLATPLELIGDFRLEHLLDELAASLHKSKDVA